MFCWSWILCSSSWKRKFCDLIYAFKHRVCLIWNVCRALQKSNSYLLPGGHCHTQSRSLTNRLVLSDRLNKCVQSVLETVAALGLGSGAAWCCLSRTSLAAHSSPADPVPGTRFCSWGLCRILLGCDTVASHPSCCSRFTHRGMAGTSLHVQASENLTPSA